MTFSPGSTPLTQQDFRQVLTPFYIKSLQVFYYALSAGVLLFFFVAMFFYLENRSLSLGASSEMADMLTIVHVVYAVTAYALATFLFRRAVEKARAGTAGAEPAEVILSAYRLATVIRLAIFEGVAFFGLVVIFIGAQTGTLQISPQYWINLFSTVVLFALVTMTFPSRERLESVCQSFLQQP